MRLFVVCYFSIIRKKWRDDERKSRKHFADVAQAF